MKPPLQILDSQFTRLGELSLRRRALLMLDGRDLYEVKLGDEFLMSSLFHEAEEALADLCLPMVPGESLDVVVGGLGLGYTAAAALRHPSVGSMLVVDALEPVITWHRKGLVPLGPVLTNDPRCRFVLGDFFAMASKPAIGFDDRRLGRKFHAVLLDIDHSPAKLLDEGNKPFYQPEGLRALAAQLCPGGVFGLWSDDPPDEPFMNNLAEVFSWVDARVVAFDNPLTGGTSSNTIYRAVV